MTIAAGLLRMILLHLLVASTVYGSRLVDFVNGTGCCPVRNSSAANEISNAKCRAGQLCCNADSDPAGYGTRYCDDDVAFLKHFQCTVVGDKCRVGTPDNGFPSVITLDGADGISGRIDTALELAAAQGIRSLELVNTQQISGIIPAAINALQDLESLTLRATSDPPAASPLLISGTLPPALGELAKLTHLVVDTTRISGQLGPWAAGPAAGVALPSLQHLELLSAQPTASSRLKGDVIEALGPIISGDSIRVMKLSGLELSGKLDSVPGQFDVDTLSTTLKVLRFQSPSAISGSLPAALGRLTRLVELEVTGFPELVGQLPLNLNQTTSLQDLAITECVKLSGTLSPSLARLTKLSNLDLHGARRISGILPTSFFDSLTALSQLRVSQVERLSGTLPPGLGGLQYLVEFQFYGTRLSGSVPDFLKDTKLVTFGNIAGNFVLPGLEFPPNCSEATVEEHPVNRASAAGSSDYVCKYKKNTKCNQGAYGSRGGCIACAKGYYQDQNEVVVSSCSNKCEALGFREYQDETGKSSCKTCTVGSAAVKGVACACNAPCAPGKFLHVNATGQECLDCDEGRYQPVVGAISSEACQQCSEGRYGVAKRTSCVKCGPGKYNPKAGSTSSAVCIPCASGRYSGASGADSPLDCYFCRGGQFSPVMGATNVSVCSACPRGKYGRGNETTRVSEANHCADCEAGTYADIPASVKCTGCEMGKWSNATLGAIAADICRDCRAGRYSSNIGAASEDQCTKCGPGTYSTALGAVQETSCQLCPVKTFNDRSGAVDMTACKKCSPGTYNFEVGQAVCKLSVCTTPGKFGSAPPNCASCPRGTYSENVGLGSEDQCKKCPRGRWMGDEFEVAGDGAKSLDDCKDCAPGYFGNATNMTRSTCSGACGPGQYSRAPFRACEPCPAGKFANGSATANCMACADDETSREGATRCVCERDFFADETGVCQPCPSEGIDCSVPGATLEFAKLEVGFWRGSASSAEFIQCPVKEACGGTTAAAAAENETTTRKKTTITTTSTNETFGDALCKKGQEGILCAVCSPAYTRWRTNDLCTPCPADAGPAIGQSIGLLFLCLVILLLLLFFNRKSSNGVMRALVHSWQMLCVVLLFWSDWPDSFTWAERILAQINLDFVSLVSPECLDSDLSVNFYWRFGLNVVWSCLLLLFVWLWAFARARYGAKCAARFQCVTRCRRRCCRCCRRKTASSSSSEEDDEGGQEEEQARDAGRRDMFLFVLLLHPIISGQAFYIFRCTLVGDTYYLMEDYSLQCYDSAWTGMAIFSCFVIVVFSFGCPAAFAATLYRRRRHLYDKDTYRLLGMLYSPYKKKCYYFESVNMCFKLALWGTLVFFDKGSQFSFAAVILTTCLHMFVQTKLEPYKYQFENFLMHLGLLMVLFMALSGLVLNFLRAALEVKYLSRDYNAAKTLEAQTESFKVGS